MLLQNTKTTGPTLLYAFVGERKVAMDGVDTENSLSVLKDRIKHKESEKNQCIEYVYQNGNVTRCLWQLSCAVCWCLSVPYTGFPPESRQDIFCYRIRAAGTGSFTGWNESMVECFNTDRL